MKHTFIQDTYRIIKSRVYILSLLVLFITASASTIQWIYKKDVSEFSVFLKTLAMSNYTYGSTIFFWIFPLITGLPILYVKEKLISSSSKNILLCLVEAFFSGGTLPFLTIIFDYCSLTTTNITYMPIPNDMITSYQSGMIMSDLFFLKPRVFILFWSLLMFVWGGLFSIMLILVDSLTNKKIFSIFILLILYLLNYVISLKTSFPSWHDLFYAQTHINNITNYIIGYALLIILNVILLMICHKIKISKEFVKL